MGFRLLRLVRQGEGGHGENSPGPRAGPRLKCLPLSSLSVLLPPVLTVRA